MRNFLDALRVLNQSRPNDGPFALIICSDGSGEVANGVGESLVRWGSYDNHVTDGQRIGAILGLCNGF